MNGRNGDRQPDMLRLTELERIGGLIPGGFFVYRADEPLDILYANQNVLRIFGCATPEEFQALTGNTFRGLVYPEDFETIQSSIDEQIADSANENFDYVEYRIIRKDGEIRWLDDYGHYALLSGYGGVYYVFISDITDKRLAQEEQLNAELQLEREKRSGEIRSALLAGISHDIRNPMRTAVEFNRQAKSHLYDPAHLRGDLENMDAALARLDRLVDNLLDMSTAEFGQMDIRPEACRLSEQIRHTTDLFRARAGSKNQTLTESFELQEDSVLADVQRLRTVLGNLLSNAISFTPEGGEIRVTVRQKQSSEAGYAQFECTVSDTGRGMSEDFLRRAQDALTKGENVTRADGSGVGHGLSITQKLLRTMGGSLSVRSREGSGSSVSVTLPLQLAAHSRRKQFESVFDLYSTLGGDNPVYLYDFHTQTARFSPALLDVLDMAGEHLSSSNGIYYWADFIHPDDRERFMRTMWEANELKRVSFDIRCRMYTKSGVYYPARFVGGVTRDQEGRPDFLGLTMKNEGLSDATDPVTGLPSRHQFFRALQQGVNGAPVHTALLLRIGRMDKINEDYGYSAGNETLRRVGRCLLDALGEQGVVYRLKGSDFALLSPSLDEEGMTALYEEARETLRRSVEVNGTLHRLLAFGGLLLRSQPPELSDREVYDYLKAACGESEQRLQGALVSCHEAGAKEPLDRQITRDIRRSMAKEFENFFLRYQPVYDAEHGRPISAEALLRWKSSQHGELTPIRFLADIEQESGFRELGYWILRSSMMDGKLFLEADPDFTVCVNVSPEQVTDARFAASVSDLAAKAAFPLDHLCLELSRDCQTLPMDMLQVFVGELRALGVRVGIDDFGSGCAWLDALRILRADYVKFSNAFAWNAVKSEADLSAMRRLTELGRAYGADVYGKAVESEEMDAALRALPLRGVQGRYYSDSLYYDEILEMLEAQSNAQQ